MPISGSRHMPLHRSYSSYLGYIIQLTSRGWWVYDRYGRSEAGGELFETYDEALDWIARERPRRGGIDFE